MKLADDWTTDALVLVQKAVNPVQFAGPEALCRLMQGADPGDPDTLQLISLFPTSEEVLRNGAADLFEPAGIAISDDQLALCVEAADAVKAVETTLRDLLEDPGRAGEQMADCLAQISGEMRPKVIVAIDVFRAVFITSILTRARNSGQQSEESLKQLSDVARKIFFISVNASVEAARVGDAGRGFAFISDEMRALSKDAQASTETLMQIIKKPVKRN